MSAGCGRRLTRSSASRTSTRSPNPTNRAGTSGRRWSSSSGSTSRSRATSCSSASKAHTFCGRWSGVSSGSLWRSAADASSQAPRLHCWRPRLENRRASRHRRPGSSWNASTTEARRAIPHSVRLPSSGPSNTRSISQRLLSELGAHHQPYDLLVARGTRFDAIRLQVRVVDTPAGGGDLRPDIARQPRGDLAQVGAGPSRQALHDVFAIVPREVPHQLLVQKQPAAVLRRRAGTRAGQPAYEVRFTFVGKSREMAPFVRHDKRPLERQEITGDQRLEKERIGGAVHGGRTEIQVQERMFRTTWN